MLDGLNQDWGGGRVDEGLIHMNSGKSLSKCISTENSEGDKFKRKKSKDLRMSGL